jgi:hypothetical protein
VARLRVRGVGAGTTQLVFTPNPTTVGEPLINLGILDVISQPTIWPPTGFGPGVRITVTEVP